MSLTTIMVILTFGLVPLGSYAHDYIPRDAVAFGEVINSRVDTCLGHEITSMKTSGEYLRLRIIKNRCLVRCGHRLLEQCAREGSILDKAVWKKLQDGVYRCTKVKVVCGDRY